MLNGVSSAGKTTLGRTLQGMLPRPWLLIGIDDLIRAMPDEDGTLLHISASGQVDVGPGWRGLEASWYRGVAAVAGSGTGVIVDEVLLGGRAGQERLQAAFTEFEVLWVGVLCDREVTRAREVQRSDRIPGMAEKQAAVVHEGVTYNLTVDTSHATPASCAAMVLSRVSTHAYDSRSIPFESG